MYERMDEIGVDYAILYPSFGLSAPAIAEEEVRRAACRVYNSINADLYRPYGDRLTPAAIIPMTTPEEALDELDFCVNQLGSKVVVFGHVRRPIPKVAREHLDAAPYALRLDTFGIDSDYDYDPVWKKCVELGVAATMHASEQSWGSRRSWSRYSYNHIGAFSVGGRVAVQVHFHGWGDEEGSRPEFRVSRGWGRLGLLLAVRHGLPLGKAKRQRHPEAGSEPTEGRRHAPADR